MHPENHPTPQDVVYRIVELTQSGELPWNFMYPNHTSAPDSSDSSLASLTKPTAYVVDDEMHGLGFVVLRADDPMNEKEDPALFLGGEQVRANPAVLNMLLDAVKIYCDEVARGGGPTPAERTAHMLRSVVNPVYEDLDNMQELMSASVNAQAQSTAIVKNLLTALLNAQAFTEQAQRESRAKTPLTPQTLQLCLQTLLGKDYDDNFEMHYDTHRCTAVVEHVSRLYQKAQSI